jgi:DNA-binding NarL/FixJ family response regulator
VGVPVDPPPAGTILLAAHEAALRGDHATSVAEWEKLGYGYEQAVELVFCDEESAMLDGVRRLDDMGTVATANLARALLRTRGVTSVPRGPTKRTRENPAGLTDRQVDVLLLLADGLTNAEISAILGKLEVATRQEAAAKVAELGLRT